MLPRLSGNRQRLGVAMLLANGMRDDSAAVFGEYGCLGIRVSIPVRACGGMPSPCVRLYVALLSKHAAWPDMIVFDTGGG